jgi:hypothetical protein
MTSGNRLYFPTLYAINGCIVIGMKRDTSLARFTVPEDTAQAAARTNDRWG